MLHDRRRNREAKACAAALRLLALARLVGAEEPLKNPFASLGGDALSVIAHLNNGLTLAVRAERHLDR